MQNWSQRCRNAISDAQRDSHVMYCRLPFLCSLPQLSSAPRAAFCVFFWQCKTRRTITAVGSTPSTPIVLHVLHKNPYSVQVVPPRRRRREERRRVRSRVRLIGMEHGAQLRILSVVGLRLFSSLARDVRGRTY